MRFIFPVIFLLVTIGIGLFSLLLLIASAKEGFAISDLSYFSFVFIALVLCVLVWLAMKRKVATPAMKDLCHGGIALSLIPLVITGLVSGSILKNYFYAKYLAQHATITHYRETVLTWPTLPSPVGVKVEIEITKPLLSGRFGNLILWMGPPGLINQNNYFFNSIPVLNTLLYNKYDKIQEDFQLGNKVKIVRYLYPNIIESVDSPYVFCKSEYNSPSFEKYVFGRNLSGALFWHHSHYTAEITQQFIPFLQQSQFENNPQLWLEMNQQFEDEKLLAAGFKQCTVQNRKHCFCKA